MGDKITELTWRSIHTDYLRFAVLSFYACDNAKTNLIFLNRHVVETIRYSYDCVEASVEFIYFMGENNQLRIDVPNNWLSRHLRRKWHDLSLSDRIGILTYAWTNQSFWKTEQQLQLFYDLKKVRDGLTHPYPFGTEIEYEVVSEETLVEPVWGVMGEVRRPTGKINYTSKDKLVNSNKAIAEFTPSVNMLGKKDAKQALEILLWHLIRIEDLFFGRRTSWFSHYDEVNKQAITAEDLLKSITPKFGEYW